ncbi:hypothetical protein Tco_0708846, partial [Tanacetum coccineum]
DEMMRLHGLGSNTETGVPYTEDEIMAIICGGKQRGHILGVDRVLPGQRTMLSQLESQPEIGGGSGSGGCGDDEQGDDEDDNEDREDEDDKLVILVNIDLYLADNASFGTSSPVCTIPGDMSPGKTVPKNIADLSRATCRPGKLPLGSLSKETELSDELVVQEPMVNFLFWGVV